MGTKPKNVKVNVTYTKEEPKRKYVYKDVIIHLPDFKRGWQIVYDYAKPNVDVPCVFIDNHDRLFVSLRKELPDDNLKLRKEFGVKEDKIKLDIKEI